MSQNRISNWLIAHPKTAAFIKTFTTFCVFGILPGSWVYGVPLLFTYGLYKQRAIAARVLALREKAQEIWQEGKRGWGRRAARFVDDYGLTWGKVAATLFVYNSLSMPFYLLGIFGIHRYSTEEWQHAFAEGLESFKEILIGFYEGFFLDTTQFKRNAKILGGVTFLGLCIHYFGIGGILLDLTLAWALPFAFVAVGAVAVWKELAAAYHQRPTYFTYKAFFAHWGKILGMWSGYRFAYEHSPGEIKGKMGPAWGQVDMQGLASWVEPNASWFTLQTGPLSYSSSILANMYKSVVTTLFFSSDMKIWGDFKGHIGPGYWQILHFAMGFGLIGWGVEWCVDKLYDVAIVDADEMLDKTTPFVHRYRSHIAFTSGASLFLGFTGGGLIGAVLSASTMGLMFCGIYTAGNRISSRYFPEKSKAPVAPEVMLPEPAPVFAPGFERAPQAQAPAHPEQPVPAIPVRPDVGL